jgi:hypothetical protein
VIFGTQNKNKRKIWVRQYTTNNTTHNFVAHLRLFNCSFYMISHHKYKKLMSTQIPFTKTPQMTSTKDTFGSNMYKELLTSFMLSEKEFYLHVHNSNRLTNKDHQYGDTYHISEHHLVRIDSLALWLLHQMHFVHFHLVECDQQKSNSSILMLIIKWT